MEFPIPAKSSIQKSVSAPDALGRAIAGASPVAQMIAARAASGMDGGHDHGADGGDHTHDHIQSRLVDHDGQLSSHDKRLANLEGGKSSDGDGS